MIYRRLTLFSSAVKRSIPSHFRRSLCVYAPSQQFIQLQEVATAEFPFFCVRCPTTVSTHRSTFFKLKAQAYSNAGGPQGASAREQRSTRKAKREGDHQDQFISKCLCLRILLLDMGVFRAPLFFQARPRFLLEIARKPRSLTSRVILNATRRNYCT